MLFGTPADDRSDWLAMYKAANENLVRADPGFAEWLESDYVPIAGGWQY